MSFRCCRDARRRQRDAVDPARARPVDHALVASPRRRHRAAVRRAERRGNPARSGVRRYILVALAQSVLVGAHVAVKLARRRARVAFGIARRARRVAGAPRVSVRAAAVQALRERAADRRGQGLRGRIDPDDRARPVRRRSAPARCLFVMLEMPGSELREGPGVLVAARLACSSSARSSTSRPASRACARPPSIARSSSRTATRTSA